MNWRDHYEGHVLETESETDDPLDYDSEDEDEDDFIDDDDDLEMYPSSPIRNSGGISLVLVWDFFFLAGIWFQRVLYIH